MTQDEIMDMDLDIKNIIDQVPATDDTNLSAIYMRSLVREDNTTEVFFVAKGSGEMVMANFISLFRSNIQMRDLIFKAADVYMKMEDQ